MYEVISIMEFYSNPSISIHAGYINQNKNAISTEKITSLSNGQNIILFFQAKTPNMLFILRSYGNHYMHVIDQLFCVTSSPVGKLMTIENKIPESAMPKIKQWVRQELNILGL